MRRVLTLLALLWAAPVAAQDTIAVPWAVAEGGVTYAVVVNGDTVSTHSSQYGAIRRGGLEAELCDWCNVRVGLNQWWRIDRFETVRMPVEFLADSATVYPAGIQPSDSVRVTDLYWMGGSSYACVTVGDQLGYAEARTQEVDGLPYWVIVPGEPDWWGADCAPSMALLPELPADDWPAYRVGILPDGPPQPVPTSPVVAYDGGTLTVTWEPSPSDWVGHYALSYGPQGGSETTSAWSTSTGYTVTTPITDGWVCVRAVRGTQLSEQRCNSWTTPPAP